LEAVPLFFRRVSSKFTLEDIRVHILKNDAVKKVCARILQITQEQYESQYLPEMLNFDQFFLLRKNTQLGQILNSYSGRTLPTGSVFLYEATITISYKRRSSDVMLARTAMIIFHEQINFLRKVLRDGKKVINLSTDKVNAEYYLEKLLFSRYNFHHVLADTNPTNTSLLKKIARHILLPERWRELHFTGTIKYLISQIINRNVAGYDTTTPSFKKFKGEQDWDETIMLIKKEPDSSLY